MCVCGKVFLLSVLFTFCLISICGLGPSNMILYSSIDENQLKEMKKQRYGKESLVNVFFLVLFGVCTICTPWGILSYPTEMMCQRLREVKCLGLCHTAFRRDYAFNQCKWNLLRVYVLGSGYRYWVWTKQCPVSCSWSLSCNGKRDGGGGKKGVGDWEVQLLYIK